MTLVKDDPIKLPSTTGQRFMQVITAPAVDRTVAIVAILPFAYLTYLRFVQGALDLPAIGAIITVLLLIGPMVIRRPPVRVTPNPWFWLLAFAATYGTLALPLFSNRGIPLAPAAVSDTIALLAIAVTVYARLSLGRNIGFVPAQRRLVTSGAYAYVRHPIYTGIFVAYAGVILSAYSPRNVGMVVVICSLLMIKSVVEENFLKKD